MLIMADSFPDFKKIEISDKDKIEIICSPHDPYSDFNFTSLWTWNTDDSLGISFFNKNLVIKIPDYITNRPVLSFLGTHLVDETIKTLIKYADRHGLDNTLKLIPELVIEHISHQKQFAIAEDADNHDYVLGVDEIATFAGGKYYDKRNLVNRFARAHPDHLCSDLDLSDKKVWTEINQLFDIWADTAKQTQAESANEKIAINRLLTSAETLGVRCLGCYVNNKLVGFAAYEVSYNKFGFISFEKAEKKYSEAGLYAVLNHEVAKKLKKMGCKYINFEQDLGIPGLKTAKQLWRPIKFLKKYAVKLG